jgi:hypothetical protein
MSKLTEAYRTIGIINDYDFAGHGNVYICRVTGGNRFISISSWQVVRPGYITKPRGNAFDAHQSFTIYGRGDNIPALERAKEWASKRYGIKEWAKTPFGSWVDADFVKKRTAELKEKLKSNPPQEGR